MNEKDKEFADILDDAVRDIKKKLKLGECLRRETYAKAFNSCRKV